MKKPNRPSMLFILSGEFTDLNNYIKVERGNKFAAAKIKADNTNNALKQLTKKLIVTEYPAWIKFVWYTKNTRKDPDNVAFAKKYILDALVTKGILRGDTRKDIGGFEDHFEVDKKNTRVEIEI